MLNSFTWWVHYTNLYKEIGKEQATGKNIYFVAGVSRKPTGKDGRVVKDDVQEKNYFVIDIDIRQSVYQQTKEVISQEDMHAMIADIKYDLDNHDVFCEWRYIVDSWNGCHVYYIGDIIPHENYSDGVKQVFAEFQKDILDAHLLEVDFALSDCSRVTRLPWTINSKKWKDWYDGDKEVVILYKQEKHSMLPAMIPTLAKKYQKIQKEKYQKAKKEYEIRKQTYTDSWSVYEAIEQINMYDLFAQHTWLKQAKDWKNFISDKDWKYVAPFYIEKDNVIYVQSTGTRHTESDLEVLWPFTYIKYEILWWADTKDVFKRAEENYSHIKQIAERERKQYKESSTVKNQTKVQLNKLYENLWYVYQDDLFSQSWWTIRSEELCMVAAATNKWKTTFVLQILKANASIGKKVCILNMEFDLDWTFRTEFFRARWYKNSEIKKLGTDLSPLDEQTQQSLEAYITKRRSEVKIYDLQQNTTLDEMMKRITKLASEGYSMIAIDAFSWIAGCAGNLDAQIEAMQAFRDFCNQTGVVIILVHHFNKWGKEYAGSGKIKDLCNVAIEITSAEDMYWWRYRTFKLSKDKPHSEEIAINATYKDGKYEEVPKELLEM